MELPTVLPPLGDPVSTAILNIEALKDASLAELTHAITALSNLAAKKIADPRTYHDVATFRDSGGADWSGFQGSSADTAPSTETETDPTASSQTPTLPIPPDNYYDSLPALGHMMTQIDRFFHVMQLNYARYVEASIAHQDRYFGTPYPKSGFRTTQHYLMETMKLSRTRAQKIIQAGKYFAYAPGDDPELGKAQPVFPEIAEALRSGLVPRDNAERIMTLDEDLTKYSQKVGQPRSRKDAALAAFEPNMAEAAQAATPEELSKAKQRWLEQMAHWVCADGPPPSLALQKQPDNALRTREHSDGSATFSVHATPALATAFKNFALHQLNLTGTPVRIPESILNLIQVSQDLAKDSEEPDPDDGGLFSSPPHTPPTLEESLGPIETWDTSPDPDKIMAEDSNGDPVNAQDLGCYEQLSTGQRIMAILIGLFNTVLTMPSKDVGTKKSHGSTTQLILVQDVETAYRTLGVGNLPEEVRRPPGVLGHPPPIFRLPNPDDPPQVDASSPTVPWTSFQSEIVNDGPIHPADAEILACNSELVGQIWDGPDEVLQEKRTKRLFTPAQRLAILARDKGCQAPGCTMPAIYSEIHHIREWLNGGTTDETNGIMLCAIHHGAVHNGKWTIRKYHGLTFFQPAPWLEPSQPLLRNVYWNS